MYFPREALTRKIHELVFDIPCFVEEHETVGLFSEEEGESLHHEINFESVQLSCVRSDLEWSSMSNVHRLRAFFLHYHQGSM